MGARAEILAKEFEGKVREAAAVLEKLSAEDWKKVTEGEKWPVGVTAHHLASAFEPVSNIITAIVSGRPWGNFTRAMLDEMNAKHAREHAHCTKAETIALYQEKAQAAAKVVRGFSDGDLAKSGTVFTDVPPMTAEQMVQGGLLGHIDEHIGSIRKTVGR
jgi:DinB superfamily